MESVTDVLRKMRTPESGGLAHDWKQTLPKGSRWQPGDPGNPSCKICGGTGYVRLDLPIGHPEFGKIHWCDCVTPEKIAKLRIKSEMAKAGGVK